MGCEYAFDTSETPYLSTICEEAYSEPSQVLGMDLSARAVGLGF